MKMLQKPAVILDDSPQDVAPLARSLRAFAGVETTHFFSIPAFERAHNINYQIGQDELRNRRVAEAIKNYSVLVCDNNFSEHTDPAHLFDGSSMGLPYLRDVIGPALKLLPFEERPLVVCYAPSSHESIRDNRMELEKLGIVSFHKQEEAAFVGLYVAMIRETGCNMRYREFIHDVLGFNEEDMAWGKRGYDFGFHLRSEYLETKGFPDEDLEYVVAGSSHPVPWDQLKLDIIKKLGDLPIEQFDLRLESVTALHSEGKHQTDLK